MFSNHSSLLGESATGTIAPRGSPEHASFANDGSGQDIHQSSATLEEDTQNQTFDHQPRFVTKSKHQSRIPHARPLSVIEEES
jgi:hypothetical protein